jgi:hypothetical protein
MNNKLHLVYSFKNFYDPEYIAQLHVSILENITLHPKKQWYSSYYLVITLHIHIHMLLPSNCDFAYHITALSIVHVTRLKICLVHEYDTHNTSSALLFLHQINA